MKVLRRLIGPVLVALVAVFLGRTLLADWREASRYAWEFDPFFLGLSVALILAYYAQQWGGWRLIMLSLGDPLSRSESAAVWFASILGRYVPGNVAMVAGRIGMYKERGVLARTTFAGMVYENALILLAALLTTAATVPLWPSFPYKGYALLLAALAPVGLAFLHPKLFGAIANAALRRFGKSPLEATLPFGRVLLLVPYYLGSWFFLGLGFCALAAAISPVPPSALPLLAGGYAFAWEVGFLSFVTPSGLGVKEAALFVVLTLIFPAPVAAALVVLSRLWQTLAELAITAAIWGLRSLSVGQSASRSKKE